MRFFDKKIIPSLILTRIAFGKKWLIQNIILAQKKKKQLKGLVHKPILLVVFCKKCIWIK